MQTRVIIVSDYCIYRNGLKQIIESQPEFKVTGEANDTDELFQLLKHEKPDVLLIDMVLLQNKILQVIKIINEKYPELHCVFLTLGNLEPELLECINNGVHGILRKESSAENLIEAVSCVVAGEHYIELPLWSIQSKIIQHVHNEHVKSYNLSELTEREFEVLKLFAEGLSYKEIGNKLFISPRTVETHKNNILNKLELHSIIDMVKYAIKHELIDL